MPNIIIHPARHQGIGSTKRCYVRVLMGVRLELVCPFLKEDFSILPAWV
jgi:hypothetical protein